MEEQREDLLSDSSEDELKPLVQTPVVKDAILSWRRVYNFPSPENFRHFVESPCSPTHSEGKASPKYAFMLLILSELLCLYALHSFARDGSLRTTIFPVDIFVFE